MNNIELYGLCGSFVAGARIEDVPLIVIYKREAYQLRGSRKLDGKYHYHQVTSTYLTKPDTSGDTWTRTRARRRWR